MTKTAITNVNIFDGRGFHEGTIVIDGAKIGDGVSNAKVIDGNGKFLIPGLIDAHVHLRSEEMLEKLAAFGVTTALDMGAWPPPMINALRGKVGLPDIRSAGAPATSPGSFHSNFPGLSNYLISNASEAENWVADRVNEGSDYIKVVSDIPGPDQATLNALISAAHDRKKLTVAHAARKEPFTMALEANADIITHVPLDKALDSAAITRMASTKCVSVPTLVMCERISKSRAPPLDYAQAHASVKSMYEAGIPILVGTDANSSPVFGVAHGESMHREMELLVDAGLSTIDVLRGATLLPAQQFGLSDRGAVEEGLRADLVLLSANPLKDISATRKIEHIWIEGVEFEAN